MRNLKKVIALVAVFAMLVSSVAFAGTFSDVAETDNYAKAIETLSALGIITGDDQDEDGVMDFRPEDTITRAEVTAIISRIQGINGAAAVATEFTDVPATHWASGYVAQAAGQGIVNGYGDGTFGPEDNVTYEQMIKMLMETLGYRPFANDNGGYPAGYTTAASRYGVLDEVIGGGIGVEASRGMVAQMVYNAIDTPLMDATSYGDEKKFGFYDGVNNVYQTLLNRDLKLIKVIGTVEENSYYSAVNTAEPKIAKIKYSADEINNCYLKGRAALAIDVAGTYYQGDVDVDPYLGYVVEAYAKKGNNGKYTIVAANVDKTVEEVSFTLDQYAGYASNEVTYEDENENEIDLKIAASPLVIYNGVKLGAKEPDALGDLFGGKIVKDGTLSGKVTLVETNADQLGYDVVRVEIGVSAVVKEVTNRGVVNFQATPKDPWNRAIKLVFDENATDTIINLTKDGEAIEYTELKEWDVVTIIWNGDKKVYDVRVLGEANYVDGYVAVAQTDYSITLSDGNNYEVADNAFGLVRGAVDPGTSGRFYIDAYGKIVALDDDIAVDGAAVVSDKYAYVLNAGTVSTGWNNEYDIVMEILDKSGEVYEAKLADKVTIKGADKNSVMNAALQTAGVAAGNIKKSTTIDLETVFAGDEDDMKAFIATLVNTVITYEGNSNGEIKTIAVPWDTQEDGEFSKIFVGSSANAEYSADTQSFSNSNNTIVTEDTKVFFIGANVAYGSNGTVAKKDNCSVASIASLVDNGDYKIAAFAPTVGGEAEVVVLLNESGQADATLNIAVIDTVGDSIVNGTDAVKTVTYWVGGEKKTAATKVDLNSTYFDVLDGAARGDIVKIKVEGDVIVYAEAIMDLAEYLDQPFDKNAAAAPTYSNTNKVANLNGAEVDEEGFYFGAIIKKAATGAMTVQPLDYTGAAAGTTKILREGNATVYVHDAEASKTNRISVGSLGEANVVDELVTGEFDRDSNTYFQYIINEDGNGNLTNVVSGPAYGMMDYVFVRTYHGVAADIVLYKNYDFGYYTFANAAYVAPTPAS